MLELKRETATCEHRNYSLQYPAWPDALERNSGPDGGCFLATFERRRTLALREESLDNFEKLLGTRIRNPARPFMMVFCHSTSPILRNAWP